MTLKDANKDRIGVVRNLLKAKAEGTERPLSSALFEDGEEHAEQEMAERLLQLLCPGPMPVCPHCGCIIEEL